MFGTYSFWWQLVNKKEGVNLATYIKSFDIDIITTTAVQFGWLTNNYPNRIWVQINGQSWVEYPNRGADNNISWQWIDLMGGITIDKLTPGTTYTVEFCIRGGTDSSSDVYSGRRTFTTKRDVSLTLARSFNIGRSHSNLELVLTNNGYDRPGEDSDYVVSINIASPNIPVASFFIPPGQDMYACDMSNFADILYSHCPNENYVYLRVQLGNRSGMSTTAYVVNSDPTFSDFNYYNLDAGLANKLGSGTYTLQHRGGLRVDIPYEKRAIPLNGASIKGYNYAVHSPDGIQIRSGRIGYSNHPVLDLGAFGETGDLVVDFEAIDSRNNTSRLVRKFYHVIPYSEPRYNINVSRWNGFEQEISLNLALARSKVFRHNSGDLNNRLVVEASYRRADSPEHNWTPLHTPITSSWEQGMEVHARSDIPNYTICDTSFEYIFAFKVEDNFSSNIYQIRLEQGIPIMVESEVGIVAINKVPDWSKLNTANLQVGTDIQLRKNGTDYLVMENIQNNAHNINNISNNLHNVNEHFTNQINTIFHQLNVTFQSDQTKSTFARLPSEWLGERRFTVTSVVQDQHIHDPYAPVQAAYAEWYNVITFGTYTRVTQIAAFGFLGQGYNNGFWIRTQHDNHVSPWSCIFFDSGWQNIIHTSLANSKISTPHWGSPVRYRKQNGIVHIQGNFSISGYSGGEELMFRMPVGYRPSATSVFTGSANGAVMTRWYVYDDGQIILEWIKNMYDANSIGGNFAWVGVDISYPAD